MLLGGICGVQKASAYTTDDLVTAGWTLVSDEAITGNDANVYVLVDAKSSAYVMANDATHFRPCYRTLGDPLENPSFVWNLEGSNNTLSLKSASTGAYFKQASGWNTSMGFARDGRTVATCTFTLNSGKYDLKCIGSNAMVGHWNDGTAGVESDGENIAANKSTEHADGFFLYAMSKSNYIQALAAARAAAVAGATKDAPVEVTSWMQNPDFSNDWGGWENTFTSVGNMQWGQKTLEAWNCNNVVVKQEIMGVPDGLYKLTGDVISGNGDNLTAYVFATGATEVKSAAVSAIASAGNYSTMSAEVAGNTLTADNCVVTNGIITVGIKIPAGWIVTDNFKLYYMGEDMSMYVEAYHAAKTDAEAVDQEAPMNATALSALQTAISTYGTGVDETSKAALLEATDALSSATTAATNSIDAYAAGKVGLDKLADLLSKTNVYTEAAYTALGYDAVLAAYNDGSWTNEEANAYTTTVFGDGGWRGSNTIQNLLLSSFDVHGGDYDHGYYINTWSIEGNSDGSGYTTPFIEYWTADGNKLGDKTIHAQMTGLPHGTYQVSAFVRLRLTNGQEAPVQGLSLQISGGDASAVSGELNYGSFYVTNVEAEGKVGTDGVLDINFNVAGANSSWVSIKDVKYTRTGDLDPSEFRAEVAAKLEVAQGLVNEVMNADVEADLNAKIAATAGYEESIDIDALIAMATNLETANEAAAASIANYKEAAAIINAAGTLDEAGQAVYESNNKVLEVKAGYDNKTLVAVTDEQKADCQAALVTATKAQTTEGSDWTTAIINPGFEGSYASIAKPTGDRDIYQPEGWTVAWTSGNENDMTSLNSTCTSWNQFENMVQPADGGDNVYWIRYNWGKQSSITLKQTVNLPAGLYELGAEGYLSNATNGKATLSAKFGDEVALVDFTASEWTKKTVLFYISEAQDVEFIYNFTENVPSTPTEIKAGVDNFNLTYVCSAATLEAVRSDISTLIAQIEAITSMPEPLATEASAAVIEAQGLLDNKVLDLNVLNNSKARLQAVVREAEFYVMIAEAEALAADDEAVAVGKLSDAIEVAKAVVTPTDEDKAALKAAIDQFNLDNADQESDQTAKVATNGWKKFDGSAAGVCATQYAPAIDTYDGRKNVNLAESYEESTAEGTAVTRLGTIIYQDIAGLKNGSYKVGFYGNAFFTEGRGGMTSPMADGATDVAYVFANEQQAFITAHIATSTTENNFSEFNVEVTDGTIRLGMGKAQAGTNWHTMQIYRLTWFTTAKALYALDKADMEAAILLAGTLYENPYKTNGKEALQQAIAEANAARISNHLNIAEFEAEIAKLNAAIEAFKIANYATFNGIFYVKNAAGKYMAAGHDWGTRGIVNETGLDLTLTPDNGNKVSFDSRVANNATNHFLSDGLYMDGPAFAWAIEQIGAEEYSISNGVKYVGVDENDNLVLVDEPAAWQFVSADDVFAARVAALNAATADNGVSATFYMQNPNFNRNDQRVEGWNVSEDCTNKNLNGGNNLNNCAESFHSTFTIKQVISGAPAGVYKLEAQGFYRQDDEATENEPVFFIGDATKAVPVKTGSENSMTQASESFTNGLYNIEPLEFVYSGEGDLEVGVKATGVHQWVIFDNFRLTYFGAAPAPEPTDYTDHIVNADLTSTDPKGFDDAGTKGIDGSGIVKAANNAVYNFNQTINLPAGQYKLTAQAAYRYSGSEADEYAAIEAGTETKFASLYANVGGVKTSALVQNRWDGASDVDYAAGDGSVVVNEKYVPNSSNAVKAWFAAGQYVNEVVFNLFDAGDVIIGIEKDAQPEAGDYTVIGPWTLTRIGDADVSTYYETIANLLTEAQGLLNSVMNATVESDLNNAVTATAGYTECTDVAVLQAMIDGLTSANATATVSVANYEEAAAIINAASVLDADGQAVYESNNKVLEVKGAYDNRTLVAVNDEQKADCQAALLVAVKAQTTEGSDWTLLIQNPGFETGDTSGWTVGASSDTGARSTSDATYAMEGAEGSWLFNTWWQGIPLTQNIGELPAGEYKLSAMTSSEGGTIFLTANDGHNEGVKSTDKGVGSLNEYTFKLYANSEVTIGVVGGNDDGSFNPGGYYWYKADVFKLTLVRAGLPELIKVVGQMNATVSQAQDDAFAAYEADPSEANYLAAAAAIDAAQVSVDAYAEGKKSLDKVDDILAKTNVYTAEAYMTFGEAHLAAQNGYNNGTWTNEEALAYGPTVLGKPNDWRGSNTIQNLLLSAFDVHGGDYDHGYYINTWSTEGDNDGSGFTTPFIEYWTGDGEVLADFTIHAQMTGLEAGVYTVTALVRQRLSNSYDESEEVTGLGLGVCSWEVIPSTGAINIAGTRFFMEEIEAQGEVFSDGKLDINFIVKSANCSWVSIKNVKFEKTGAPTGIKSLDVEEEGALKDGKYFIKDKIVIVKNGKMYNAAGGLQK